MITFQRVRYYALKDWAFFKSIFTASFWQSRNLRLSIYFICFCFLPQLLILWALLIIYKKIIWYFMALCDDLIYDSISNKTIKRFYNKCMAIFKLVFYDILFIHSMRFLYKLRTFHFWLNIFLTIIFFFIRIILNIVVLVGKPIVKTIYFFYRLIFFRIPSLIYKFKVWLAMKNQIYLTFRYNVRDKKRAFLKNWHIKVELWKSQSKVFWRESKAYSVIIFNPIVFQLVKRVIKFNWILFVNWCLPIKLRFRSKLLRIKYVLKSRIMRISHAWQMYLLDWQLFFNLMRLSKLFLGCFLYSLGKFVYNCFFIVWLYIKKLIPKNYMKKKR